MKQRKHLISTHDKALYTMIFLIIVAGLVFLICGLPKQAEGQVNAIIMNWFDSAYNYIDTMTIVHETIWDKVDTTTATIPWATRAADANADSIKNVKLSVNAGAPSDGDILKYFSTGDTLGWAADNSGGTTAYDDIQDPDAAGSISFSDASYSGTYTSNQAGWLGITISNTVADVGATDQALLSLEYIDDDDEDAVFMVCMDSTDAEDTTVIIGTDGIYLARRHADSALVTKGYGDANWSGGSAIKWIDSAAVYDGWGLSVTYDGDDTLRVNSSDLEAVLVTGVTAGNGLTGGGTEGTVTLNIGAGTGITVNADDIEATLGTSVDLTAEVTGTLPVANGGTGAATLTDHGILLGSGTDAVTPLGAATNGQLPIGSTGADPVLAALTGTAHQIGVTNGAGSITLAYPYTATIATSPTLSAGQCVFGTNGLLFEGTAADANELVLITAGLSSDYTVTIPAASFTIPNPGAAVTLTGNWVNTTNPWADNEVADNITVTGYMQDEDINTFAELQSWVSDKTLVNEEDVFTIDANWVNETSPWADNEIASSGNWNTAYGWGDHSTQNYLDDDVEGDVDAADIAAGVVTTYHIQNDSIQDPDIDWGTGANQVSGSDLPDEDMGDISISSGTWSIDNNAVNTSDIAASAVTEDKLSCTNSPTNGYVLSYSTGGPPDFTWVEDQTGGTTAYDDIGDPDGNGSIAFGAHTGTYTTATSGWGGLTISNTAVDQAADAVLLSLEYGDDGDADSYFLLGLDNSAADTLFWMEGDGIFRSKSIYLGTTHADSSVETIETIEDSLKLRGLVAGQIWTGAHDFGGATSTKLPNGTAPTTDEEGEIAWDNNDDAIEVYSGDEGESALIPMYQKIDACIFAPDGVNDVITLLKVDALLYPHGIEIDQISFTLPADAAYGIGFHEWTGADPPVFSSQIDSLSTTASDAYVEDGSPTDGAIAADATIRASILSTDVDWVHIQIIYHVTEGN